MVKINIQSYTYIHIWVALFFLTKAEQKQSFAVALILLSWTTTLSFFRPSVASHRWRSSTIATISTNTVYPHRPVAPYFCGPCLPPCTPTSHGQREVCRRSSQRCKGSLLPACKSVWVCRQPTWVLGWLSLTVSAHLCGTCSGACSPVSAGDRQGVRPSITFRHRFGSLGVLPQRYAVLEPSHPCVTQRSV